MIERTRKRIEEAFGWAKTIGGIARLKVRGIVRAPLIYADRTFQSLRLLETPAAA